MCYTDQKQRHSQGLNAGMLAGMMTIWHRRKGTQGLNTQGRGRQLDTGETH